jgi:hypothetical protein
VSVTAVRRCPPAVVAAAVGLFIATVVWRFLTFTGFTNDHYAHLALAQQLLLGERPIRDFADPGWPLTYLLSAAAWRVAGSSLAVEWAVTATALGLAAACTAAAAYRLSGSVLIASLMTVLEIVIYPRTYSYPKLLAYSIGGLAMIAMAARPSPRRMLIMSAVVAMAFLFRHDHGLFIGVAAAGCVVLASRHEGWRTGFQRGAALTIGTGLFLLPWIAFVSLNGGLVSYFQGALEYARVEARVTMLRSWPRFQLAPGKPLLGLGPASRPLAQVEWTPATLEAERQDLERRYGLEYVRAGDETRFYYVRDTHPDNLRALADDPHVAGTAGLGRVNSPRWRVWLATMSPLRLESALNAEPNAVVWLFWLFWALPLLCLPIGVARFLRGHERWPGEMPVVLSLSVMAILVNAGFLRNILDVRLPDAIVPAALLAAWALGAAWTGDWRCSMPQSWARTAAVIVLMLTTVAIGRVSAVREQFAYSRLGGGIAGTWRHAIEITNLLSLSHRQVGSSRNAQALVPFFEYLDRCTSETDRLIVTGEFPDILVAAGRPFASDGVVFGAWYSSLSHQDRTLERLRLRPGLFAIHMSQYEQFRERYPLIDEYITQAFEPMAEVPVDGGDTIRILVYANRRAAGRDAKTGWPCFR